MAKDPSLKDRIQLSVVLADSQHERDLSLFILGAHDLPQYIPPYRAALQELFLETRRIRKPRALWTDYK